MITFDKRFFASWQILIFYHYIYVSKPEPYMYFAMKEACELEINKRADMVNDCWACDGLNGPVPKYPDAGRNFELYAMLDNSLR